MLAIRTGRAPTLRRRSAPASTEQPLPAGFDVVSVGFSDLYSAAEEITRHAADVVVLEPPELRELVLRGLSAVAATAGAAA